MPGGEIVVLVLVLVLVGLNPDSGVADAAPQASSVGLLRLPQDGLFASHCSLGAAQECFSVVGVPA